MIRKVKMEPDFEGWATKANLKCTDGVTIAPDAFRHQDTKIVPLVWQHAHNDPDNVLGHVQLEARNGDVWAKGFFNKSNKAETAKELLSHGDIRFLSIWANEIIKKSALIVHGAIKEVSLVLAGANPGAVIEKVTIVHSDGYETDVDDELLISPGEEIIVHADESKGDTKADDEDNEDDMTVEDIFESFSEAEKDVVYYLVGTALEAQAKDFNEAMKDKEPVKHSDDIDEHGNTAPSNAKENNMAHNVFDSEDSSSLTLSHEDKKGIFADAMRIGSLHDAVEAYAIQHGITDINVLFPEATNLDSAPEWVKRNTEWVAKFMDATTKSPFSRIRTRQADITHEEARAKGYVTGEVKKEEFFQVKARTTTPTTVYKKQKLDRDDVVDINDFDVVAWLKAEMRVMLDEELARAALVGDGRDISDADKINEQCIRPIASDHQLYTTQVNINIDDASSSLQEVIDAIILNRRHYKGTGLPTFFTTEYWLARFLLLKDSTGRRIYKTVDELATEFRVVSVVPTDVLEDDSSILGIMVNPSDYVFGANRGGEVNMFDDFDIDYNQHKYLIETRLCGALAKVKSAVVFNKTGASDTLVTPTPPSYNKTTWEVTIPTVSGVIYKNAETGATMTTGASPYSVAAGDTLEVVASADTGRYLSSTADSSWTFFRPPA